MKNKNIKVIKKIKDLKFRKNILITSAILSMIMILLQLQ